MSPTFLFVLYFEKQNALHRIQLSTLCIIDKLYISYFSQVFSSDYKTVVSDVEIVIIRETYEDR